MKTALFASAQLCDLSAIEEVESPHRDRLRFIVPVSAPHLYFQMRGTGVFSVAGIS